MGSKDGARTHLIASAYLNSFKSLAPHAGSTGLRTAQLRFNALAGEMQDVAGEFLIGSQYRRGDREFDLSVQAYFEDAALAMVSKVGRKCDRSPGQRVVLPPPLPLGMALHEALGRRRSIRDFSGNPLELEQLSTLLHACGGVTAVASTDLKGGGSCSLSLRTAPSGGGLFPIDVHLVARRVNGLAPGQYGFDNQDAALTFTQGQQPERAKALGAALAGAFVDVEQVAAFVVLSVMPWRSTRKYNARGLRFALMEVGGISQNLHLAATALGIPSCDYGGFYDDEVNMALGFDGASELAIHVILLGG